MLLLLLLLPLLLLLLLCRFKDLAKRRNVNLDCAAHPHNEKYQAFLTSIGDRDYVIQLTAFWAIERVYNEGWAKQQETAERHAGPYWECLARWGSKEFASYVLQLEEATNEAISRVPEVRREATEKAARDVVLAIADLEVEFWDMARSTPPPPS